VEFVLSANLHRRHLTVSQRSALAVEILPRLEKEAKDRQRLSKGRGKKGTAKLQHLFGESSEQAAKLVGVSTRSVATAKELKKSDDGLFLAIKEGRKTLSDAKKESDRKRRDREIKTAAAGVSDAGERYQLFNKPCG
jgi:hypothetical protein